MSVRKSDEFIADVERQYLWYLENATEAMAEGYLTAVAATCRLLGQHAQLGPRGGFDHARLRDCVDAPTSDAGHMGRCHQYAHSCGRAMDGYKHSAWFGPVFSSTKTIAEAFLLCAV